MRVLFTTFEGGGHVPAPLLTAAALRDLGHDVLIVSDPCNAPAAEAKALPFKSWRRAPDRGALGAESGGLSDWKTRWPDALLGMSPTDPIAQGSSTSVKAFVETIVTARSRVLHGTWSALGPDLPQRNGLGVRRSDVEHLARTLLVVASHQLDAYQSAGEQSDNVLDLLAWSKARRTSASSAP